MRIQYKRYKPDWWIWLYKIGLHETSFLTSS
ncbi:hypothetical protein LCGC14_1582160 [marine sediment metagenome]|uniref:Uncharacterized protein n=1 Tax=marine sediment metagenome TaxID=412755 RepID=A0A0F9IGQ7_9ZZZZ